jgi:hypothetical protein
MGCILDFAEIAAGDSSHGGIKFTALWNETPCSLIGANFSEKPATSICIVMPEGGGGRILGNVGTCGQSNILEMETAGSLIP